MSVNAITKPSRDANLVYIKILVIVDRRKKEFATGLKIPKSLWNKNKREVKKNKEVDYKLYNTVIREKIEEVRVLHDNVDISKFNKRSSFLSYFDKEIQRLKRVNSPSLAKHKTVKSHLINYCDFLEKKDFTFMEINYSWIRNFEGYFSVLGLGQNTRTTYLKNVQKVYREALRDGTFRTTIDPFSQYKFKKEIIQVDYLSKDHIKKLCQNNYAKGSRLEDTKHKFLFQFFGNGMRSSDMFFMRFNNIRFDGKKTRFEFFQFKTKIPHSITIDQYLMKQIIYFINTDKYYEMYHDRLYEYEVGGSIQKRTFNQIKDHYNALSLIGDDDESLISIKEFIDEKFEDLYREQLNILKEVSKSRINDFIIPVINNDLFKDSKFDSKHRHSNKQRSHHSGRLTIYNRYLKEIDELLESGIKIVSHTARHTFANVQLNNGAGVYTISKSLGHQDIKTTQSYLENFNKELIDRKLNESNEKLKYDLWTDIY